MAFLLTPVLALGTIALAAAPASSMKAPMTATEQALHVLNRLGFGPRPGDVDRVLAMGVPAYIEQQMAPAGISDDATTAALKRFPTLAMTTAELVEKFELPLREARRQRRMELAGQDGADLADEIEAVRQRIPPQNRPRRVLEELTAARIVRAAQSERQLNEVLVDFWMNHFNVFAGKGLDRVFTTSFERDVIRPRIWGRFEDMLLATAKSPAMLVYLDNAQSTADEAHRPARPIPLGRALYGRGLPGGPAKKGPAGGLNENYARELMELHTLGVDGGYTQTDVTELARILTGWSVTRPEQGGGFVFRAPLHDVGSKSVLGNVFPAGGGIEEGERMIRILARDPSTARHIAFQLCQRLVVDVPPPSLVDRVANTFLATDGDLRATVRSIVTSPEFFDPRYYRAKVKSPFEYVVSAVRALGAEPDEALPLARQLVLMGEPLYLCQPPTGYSDTAEAWVNTGALLARLNFALRLAAGSLPGTRPDLRRLVSPDNAADSKKSVDILACAFLGENLSAETRQTVGKRLEEQPAPDDSRLAMIAGLILGSPEFQRQ